MTSVVMLAGYNRKREVEKYARTVAQHYGEQFIETGYKPLRTFEVMRNGVVVQQPLIQFTLEQLFAVDEVDDIVIIGHRELLEQRLRKFIDGFDKTSTIIDQSAQLPVELIERFQIVPRKVRVGSIARNIILGYAASKACESQRHALFVGSDSPFTSRQFIEYCLRVGRSLESAYAIVVPAVLVKGDEDRLGRIPLKMLKSGSS